MSTPYLPPSSEATPSSTATAPDSRRVPRLRSLRFKLVFASVVVEVLLLGLLVFNSHRLIEQKLADQTRLRVEELNPLLNAALAAPLVERDYATLGDLLAASRRTEGLTYLALLDNRGKVVASAGWLAGKPLPPLNRQITESDPDSPYRYDTETPITLAGQRYGTLRYGLATDFLAAAKATLLEQSLGIALTEVALSILLLSLLGLWLTRNLAQLHEASRQVAAGNLAVQLPVMSHDEVGELTAAFNTMSQALAERVRALDNSQARLISLLSAMSIGILFEDVDNRVIYFNPAFRRIWLIPEAIDLKGQRTPEVLRHSANVLARPDHFSRHILQVLATREVSETFEIVMADGRILTQLSYPVRDHEGRYIGRLWVYEDVTRERQTAEQLLYLAERDSLTGLYNRHRFQEELGRMLAEVERRHSTGALLFFDLDEFKYVNDTFGHRAGDAMLVRVAGEVSTLVRRNEILARLGGDEFAVLVPDTNAAESARLAERIIRAISQIPFRFEGQNLRLTTSLGIAHYPDHGTNAEDLIAHADAAMYQAKESGKNAWRVYRADLDASREMLGRMSWHERLGKALEHGLLRLHFQGIYRAGDGALSHLEVLVRMVDEADPTRLIMPGHFIAYAEKSGKIRDVDRWVIAESARLLGAAPQVPALAVNISGRSFDDPLLAQYIAEQLARHRVDPARFMVELTETAAVSDLHDAQRFIEALRQTGCRVCLDDFGTGFSSFAYLKYLQADILKIDGLFIRDLPHDRDNQVFVKSIVDVARGMRKITIAEFVEDAETLEMLKQFGVDMVQGYHLDMPRAAHPALTLVSAT
jgi:diguanylate cyclase (GGDEF)-like protein